MLRSVAREVAGISRKLTYLASTQSFREVANSWPMSANALNSNAFPDGSVKNMRPLFARFALEPDVGLR